MGFRVWGLGFRVKDVGWTHGSVVVRDQVVLRKVDGHLPEIDNSPHVDKSQKLTTRLMLTDQVDQALLEANNRAGHFRWPTQPASVTLSVGVSPCPYDIACRRVVWHFLP